MHIAPASTALLGAVLLLAPLGCATRTDLERTISELNIIKYEQATLSQQLMAQIDVRSKQLASEQQDISAEQAEFRAESDAISRETAQLGGSMGALRRELAAVSAQLKELRNTQAIGMGSLSARIDQTSDNLATDITANKSALDQFASQVAEQVDGQAGGITTLSKSQSTLKAQGKKRDQSIAALAKSVDALATKLGGKLTQQSKKISGLSGKKDSSAGLKALKTKVDFLGKKLPKQIDNNGKKVKTLSGELRHIQKLLGDLNKRLQALEKR